MGKHSDPFVILLISTLLLGWILPLPIELEALISLLSRVGIGFIFLFYGLKLDIPLLVKGIKSWKAHLLVQASTFILFPLFVLLFLPIFQLMGIENLWLPLFFLAALPSTVSSSVVFTNIAKGNLTIAIFNASVSGVIAVFLTPIWMGFFMEKSEGVVLLPVFTNLFFQIILPLVIGLLLNKHLRFIPLKFPVFFKWYDKVIILLIVYKSFSSSFQTSLNQNQTITDYVIIVFVSLLLFGFINGIVQLMINALGFSNPDRKAILLCSTQKSLVHGSVFVLLLIDDPQARGIFLIPIMIYHTFQLLYFANVSTKWVKKNI